MQMTLRHFILTVLALMSFVVGAAKTVTDTLRSSKGDRLFLSYDVQQSGNEFIVRFLSVRPSLGLTHREKYRRQSEIVPMIFDQTGGYSTVRFDGLSPDALMVPAGVGYTPSEEGYFNLQEHPTVTFTLRSDKAAHTLIIPVYLTHYEKKLRYNIFCRCGQLKIKLSRAKTSNSGDNHRSRTTEIVTQTITSTSEVEVDNADITTALATVSHVMAMLDEADRLPFSDNLISEAGQLRVLKNSMTDASTLQRINDALDAYDAKKRELQETSDAAAAAAQAEAEQKAQEEQAAEQAKADAAAAKAEAEAKAQEEKSQKRTIWMIIGGAILAVFCFVGNQVAQHFRNVSNQRSMQEMQDRMVRQAENDAKRRAQSYAHNRVHQAKNAARNSARDALAGIKTKKGGSMNRPKTI